MTDTSKSPVNMVATIILICLLGPPILLLGGAIASAGIFGVIAFIGLSLGVIVVLGRSVDRDCEKDQKQRKQAEYDRDLQRRYMEAQLAVMGEDRASDLQAHRDNARQTHPTN